MIWKNDWFNKCFIYREKFAKSFFCIHICMRHFLCYPCFKKPFTILGSETLHVVEQIRRLFRSTLFWQGSYLSKLSTSFQSVAISTAKIGSSYVSLIIFCNLFSLITHKIYVKTIISFFTNYYVLHILFIHVFTSDYNSLKSSASKHVCFFRGMITGGFPEIAHPV